jgi:hypothetical protein
LQRERELPASPIMKLKNNTTVQNTTKITKQTRGNSARQSCRPNNNELSSTEKAELQEDLDEFKRKST